MARLPMPMKVTNLRFTADNAVSFRLEWDGAHAYASVIDHFRVRFMLTNLHDVGIGITDAQIQAEMESWDDQDPPVAAETMLPTGWDANIKVYRGGMKLAAPADPTTTAMVDGTFTNIGLMQRFVRCIAQARTAD